MSQRKKVLLVVASMAILLVGSMMATYAYFTDFDEVENTFTVGKVEITMDEAKVDAEGQATQESRVTENDYHLIPGLSYDKDPTIHVAANSEDCYLYVTVDNQIKALVDATTIENQMVANGWSALEGVTFGEKDLQVYVYGEKVVKSASVQDVVVFNDFTIKGEGVTNDTIAPFVLYHS